MVAHLLRRQSLCQEPQTLCRGHGWRWTAFGGTARLSPGSPAVVASRGSVGRSVPPGGTHSDKLRPRWHLSGCWAMLAVIEPQGNRLNPPLLPTTWEACAVRNRARLSARRKKVRTTECHGVRVQSASREAQCILLRGPRRPPCLLRAENLADVPTLRSPRSKTIG
jgi:hypothetical protein